MFKLGKMLRQLNCPCQLIHWITIHTPLSMSLWHGWVHEELRINSHHYIIQSTWRNDPDAWEPNTAPAGWDKVDGGTDQ